MAQRLALGERFPPVSPSQDSKAGKKNQRATAKADLASRTSGHSRTHRSPTAAAMSALQKWIGNQERRE
jgi:hypothetical protein